MSNVGHGSYIGFGEQVTPLVAVAPTHFLEVIEMGMEPNYDRVNEEHLGRPSSGESDEITETYVSRITAAGPISILVGYNNASLLWWKHCLGAINTTGTGPWQHVLTPTNSVPAGTAGLTVAQTHGLRGPVNRQRVFDTVAPTKWEFAWEAGKRGVLKVDNVGAKVGTIQAIAGSPTFEADPPIAAYQHLTAAGFNVNGGTKVEGLESIKIMYDRKFISPAEMGTLYGDTPTQDGPADVSVELGFRWKDNTLLALFESGAYVDGSCIFSDGTHSLEFAFPRLQVQSHPLAVSSRGLTRVTAKLKALRTSSAPSITITSTSDRENP